MIGVLVATKGESLDHVKLPVEAFTLPQTRECYEACQRLYGRGVSIDVTALVGELGDKYEQMGKSQFEAIIQWVPPENVGMYEGILKDKLLLRRLKGVGDNILRGVTGDRVNPLDVLGRATTELGLVDASGDSTNLMPKCLDEMQAELLRMEMGEVTRYISTGIPWYDEALGGILGGEYTAICSRPGCGKTALMEAIIQHLVANVDRPVPTLVFQRDMNPKTFAYRLACRAAKVEYKNFHRGHLGQIEFYKIREAIKIYRECPIILKSPAGMTVDTMVAEMRREVRVSKVEAVFLDHVQTLSSSDDAVKDLTRASLALRAATTDLGIALTVLAHTNRQGEERPTASNIKGFDQLFGDVDGLLLLWEQKKKDDETGDAVLTDVRKIIATVGKCRSNSLKDIPLLFHGRMMSFEQAPKVRDEDDDQ